MTLKFVARRLNCLSVCALLLVPLAVYSQTTLTGAIQFSTNSLGAASGGQEWNTLGGDTYFNLWLALNPDATSPVNGPSDQQAGISLPLEPDNNYTFHIFGQPGCCSTAFNGLNLFFDGNNSTPGISALGATNVSGFVPNGNSTFTLQATPAAGSGRSSYSSNGVVVVLTGYDWNTPATPPGDICQPFTFAPGGGADYFGSFTLRVWPAATLTVSQASASPGTNVTLTGSGFSPTETVHVYFNHIGSPPLYTAITDGGGSFILAVHVPSHAYGPTDVFAGGQTSGKLGATGLFVTPRLVMNPNSGGPGGTTAVQGFGFGAGEPVKIYWSNPRQFLGTATANGLGSFSGQRALTITIPTNASAGLNGVIGVGQITNAIGIGPIAVQ